MRGNAAPKKHRDSQPAGPDHVTEEWKSPDRGVLAHRELHCAFAKQIDSDHEQSDGSPDVAGADGAFVAKRVPSIGLAPTDAIADQEQGRRNEAEELAGHFGL